MDKTLRLNIDNSDFNQKMADSQKRIDEATNASNRFSRTIIGGSSDRQARQPSPSTSPDKGREPVQERQQETKEIEKQIHLLEEKAKIEEEDLRTRIRLQQEGIRAESNRLQLWKLERQEGAEKLSGREKQEYVSATRKEEIQRRKDLEGERSTLLNLRHQFEEQKDLSKKQLQELRDLPPNIDKNEDKRDKDRFSWYDKLLSGLKGVSGGGVSGGLGMLSRIGPVGQIAAIGLGMGANAASGLRDYSVTTQQSNYLAQLDMLKGITTGNVSTIGMTEKEFMNTKAKYMMMYGGNVSNTQAANVVSMGISRPISDQQIGDLLRIQRYTGQSVTGTTASFENYLKSTDQSITRLPEVIDLYTKTANEILSRVGKVDAKSVQEIISGLGSSLNINGVNLQRMTAGVIGGATESKDPAILAVQQQVMRRLNPRMNMWEMHERLQNPTTDPAYIQTLYKTVMEMGKGSETYSKFLMEKFTQGKLSTYDIDKIFQARGINIPKTTVQQQTQAQHIEKGYGKDAQAIASEWEKLEATTKNAVNLLGVLVNSLSINAPEGIGMLIKKLIDEGPYKTQEAVRNGMNQSLNQNKKLFESKR